MITTQKGAVYIETPVEQGVGETQWLKLDNTKFRFSTQELTQTGTWTDTQIETFTPISTGDKLILVDSGGYGELRKANNSVTSVIGTVSNVDLFSDGSGIALYEFEGNANDTGGTYNGTWSGTEAYATGKFGQAASFDGSSEIQNNNLNIGSFSAVTFSFWAATTQTTTFKIIGASDDGNSNDFALEFNNGTDFYPYFRTNLNPSTVTNAFINDGTLHHYVIICDSSGSKIYRDQVYLGTSTQQISTTSSLFRIGNVVDLNGNVSYYNGIIDQVRIFNRALTVDEITQLYNEQATKYTATFDQLPFTPTKAFKGTDIVFLTEFDDKTRILKSKIYNIPLISSTTSEIVIAEQLPKNQKLLLDLRNEFKVDTAVADGSNYKYDISSLQLTEPPTLVHKLEEMEFTTTDNGIGYIKNATTTGLDLVLTNNEYIDNGSSKLIQVNDIVLLDRNEVNIDSVIAQNGTTSILDIFGDGSCVALYEFEGNANDTGGTYNGTWSGTESYATGKFGQAASFDGSRGIVIPEPLSSFNFSVSFWVKTTDNTGQNNWYDNTIIGFDEANAGTRDFTIGTIGDNLKVRIETTADSDVIFDTGLLVTDGKWHFVVVNFNVAFDGSFQAFVDGVNKTYTGSVSVESNMANFNWGIGCAYNSDISGIYSGSEFNGLIDQVRIFNRALTNSEVQQLYNEYLQKLSLTYLQQTQAPTSLVIPSRDFIRTPVFTYDSVNNQLEATFSSVNNMATKVQRKILVSEKDVEFRTPFSSDLYKEQ